MMAELEEWLKLNRQMTSSTIDKIEEVRRQNNTNWMDLVRLAIRYAPANEVKRVLDRIETADREVNGLWKFLREKLWH